MTAGSRTWLLPLACAGVLLALWASIPATAEAQELHLGPRAGLTLGAVRYQDPASTNQMELRPGFHLGATAQWDLTRHFATEGSLLFSQEGFRGTGAVPGNLRMDYLVLPVLARARLPGRVSPHLSMGISVRYLLRCVVSGLPLVGSAGCDDSRVGMSWKRVDVGLVAGVGMGVEMGQRTLLLDGLVELGLRDIKDNPLPPGKARSGAFRISLGFLSPAGDRR